MNDKLREFEMALFDLTCAIGTKTRLYEEASRNPRDRDLEERKCKAIFAIPGLKTRVIELYKEALGDKS